MKLFFRAFAFLIFIQISLCGARSSAQDTKPANALLWKIQGTVITKPSYLFGTFHLLNSDYIDSLKPLWKAFDSTNCMVGEIDMSNADMSSIVTSATMDSLTLHDLISQADYSLLDSILRSRLGLPLSMMQSIKPNAIAALLEASPYISKIRDDSTEQGQAMDLYLQTRARERKSDVFGLETVEQQCHILFDSIAVKEQARQLAELLHQITRDTSASSDLERCYDEEDLPCIAKSETDGTMNARELQVMITDRNIRWIPKFATLINDRPTFFAVGAGHLVGPEGLLALLEAEGFTVTPIKVHEPKKSHDPKHR